MVSMETMGACDRDVLIDLESGNNIIIHEQNNGIEANSRVGQARAALNGMWNGVVGTDGCLKDERTQPANCCSSLPLEGAAKIGEPLVERKSEGEENMGLLENLGGEKPKKKRSKKPPRPPRPSTPSPLDATDQKLINELSELAMMKRARIERMKALKKMKNAKPASTNSNLCALIVTVIFCLVIFWQGVFSRHGVSISFRGSPESSVGTNDRMISIRFYKNDATISPHGSTSASPNNEQTASGLKIHGETTTIAG